MVANARTANRWPIFAAGLLILLLAGFAAYRARQPEFAFLAGRKPLGPAWDVPDNLGGGPTMREQAYAFPGDATDLVKLADAQLLHAGWSKDTNTDMGTSQSGIDHEVVTVTYKEVGGQGRFLWIQKDCSHPTTFGASDLEFIATYQPGWVGVTLDWPKKTLTWQDQVRHWFSKLLHGAP